MKAEVSKLTYQQLLIFTIKNSNYECKTYWVTLSKFAYHLQLPFDNITIIRQYEKFNIQHPTSKSQQVPPSMPESLPHKYVCMAV